MLARVGRNSGMRRISTLILGALILLPGCGGDKKTSTDNPQQDKASEATSSTGVSSLKENNAAPEKAPAEPVNAEETPAAAAVQAVPTEPAVLDQLVVPALPKPNADGFFIMMQKASNGCRPDDRLCVPIQQLAARIPVELEAIAKLVDKGTDQQKNAIRKALLLTNHKPAVALLLKFAVDQSGQLDAEVIKHALALRTDELAPILQSCLKKAVGTNVKAAIIALSRLGTPKAVEVLKTALQSDNAKPYLGDVCQALARSGSIDSLATVTALGSRLDGSRRQREGCRNSEAALRMVGLPSRATLLLDGKQYRSLGLTAEQRTPRTITLMFTENPKATCEDRGPTLMEIDIPLSWTGVPIIGQPLVASVRVGADELAENTAYYTRLDSLELKAGNQLSGIGLFSHVPVKGAHRLVMQGSFEGIYCGARPN